MAATRKTQKAEAVPPAVKPKGKRGGARPGAGRKKLNLDEAKVADLAFGGASDREIAVMLGVDNHTIANRFRKLVDFKRAERRQKIRDLQMRAAQGGAAAILIWLGKNELGQSDQAEAQKQVEKVEIVIGSSKPKSDSGEPDQSPG